MRSLAIDPGDTLGWSTWENWALQEADQTPLWPFLDALAVACGVGAGNFGAPSGPDIPVDTASLAGKIGRPDLIVCEDWVLYEWKAQDMAWNAMRTPRGIGAIELLGRIADIPVYLQSAQIKDTAVAAGAEELFVTPLYENRHANDSIMHEVYFRIAGEGKDLE